MLVSPTRDVFVTTMCSGSHKDSIVALSAMRAAVPKQTVQEIITAESYRLASLTKLASSRNSEQRKFHRLNGQQNNETKVNLAAAYRQ
jgi:hypothetical protein